MEQEVHKTIPVARPAAVVGNGETCALVGTDGTIYWLTFPHAAGVAWLDVGADFTLSPLAAGEASFEYVGQTPVLQTKWCCGESRACVTDFLPVRGAEGGGLSPRPRRRLIRMVEVVEGDMEFAFRLAPRPRGKPVDLVEDPAGLLLVGEGEAMVLQTSGEVRLRGDGVVTDTFRLARGQRRVFVLTWHMNTDPDIVDMPATEPDWELDGTYDYWLAWERRCPFDGVQRPYILRILALLAASHIGTPSVSAPSFVASPTRLSAAAALAAWGYEEALPERLETWRPQGTHLRDFLEGAGLLDLLAEGYVTGLIGPSLWLPYEITLARWAGHLAEVVLDDAIAHVSTADILTCWLGLRGVMRLADEGLWRSDTARVSEAARRLVASLAGAQDAPPGWGALLQDGENAAGLFLDDPERPDLGWHDTLWAIRCTLDGGAYTQARRALDRFWLNYSPVWKPVPPVSAGADPAHWTQAAWLSARIYLQGPPAPGRVDLPDAWD